MNLKAVLPPRLNIKRRTYLLQLIVTSILLVLLPFVLSLFFLCRQSYRQLMSAYQEQQLEGAKKFASAVSRELNDIYAGAYRISAESRDVQKDASQLDEEILKTNPYYIYAATKTVSNYCQRYSNLAGVYYYGLDRLVGNNYAFSPEQYWNSKLESSMGALTENEAYRAFFSQDTEEPLLFAAPNRKSMLVGVRVRIGAHHGNALLVYKLDQDVVDAGLLPGENTEFLQRMVFSGDGEPLLSFGADYLQEAGLEGVVTEHLSEERFSLTEKAGEEPYIVSGCRSMAAGFTYVVLSPLDKAATGLSSFYAALLRILPVMCAVLLAAIALLIYLNYRPITRTLRKLNISGRSLNEFKGISDSFDQMASELSRQNMLIVDSLLGNILYGVPISEEMLRRTGLPADSGCFVAYTLSGAAVNSETFERIAREMAEGFSARVFLTDILFQDLTVLICMSPEDRSGEIFDFLKKELCPEAPACLRRGKTVYSINEIKDSFDSSFGPRETAGKGSDVFARDPAVELMQQILRYIDGNFRDPLLSQSSVADHFRISAYSLSRLFKSKTGTSFTEYVTARRMQLAQELLSQKDVSIARVAEEVGIPNVNYFYKVFKTFTGTSPAKFQKTAGEAPANAGNFDLDKPSGL